MLIEQVEFQQNPRIIGVGDLIFNVEQNGDETESQSTPRFS